MPLPEKTDRNIEIYLKKYGFGELGDTEATKEPISYRKLMFEYDLSLSRLQGIVNRYRVQYGPEKEE